MSFHGNGATRLESLEESFNATVERVAMAQEELDSLTVRGSYVPRYLIDEYEEAISLACAFSQEFGFSFDPDDYAA